MKTKTIFCSACDRDVVIRVPDDALPNAQLEGAVCLDIGALCTGAMCPICAIPPQEIRDRLRENT